MSELDGRELFPIVPITDWLEGVSLGFYLHRHLVEWAWHVTKSLQLELIGKVAILSALHHLEVIFGICVHLVEVSERVQLLLGVRVIGLDMTSTVASECSVWTSQGSPVWSQLF